MCDKSSLLFFFFFTMAALIYFFSRVCPVLLLIARESFITMAALKWCLSNVSSLMHYKKIKPTRKPYHKGCIGMVSAQYVFYDVSQWLHWNGASPVWVLLCITRKSFITKDTLEWFLPSMSSLGDISEVVVV